MRGACIDIGSNTTRLLVADCDGDRLTTVAEERVFTHIRRAQSQDGTISEPKLTEVAVVVAGQARHARELGAVHIRAVATAAIRRATNGMALAQAIQEQCGLPVAILSEQEEARLAFVGASNAVGASAPPLLGVVDVGGGSSELVLGVPPRRIQWCTSFAFGSSDLTQAYLKSDPPASDELAAARGRVAEAFAGLEAPRPIGAVAVGGSATSMGRVAGPVLDATAFQQALELLCSRPADVLAGQLGLAADRVRLLPAGLLILESASGLFDLPLSIGGGGIREGVLLESCSG